MAVGYAAFRYMSSPKSANHAYFDGKVVWVTGASSGIGKELCKQLVEKSKGVRLILSSRKEETLRELKEELVAAGARAKDVAIVTLDLGDKETLEAAVERAFKAFGSVDVLVNNAGISQRSLARMTSPVVYDRLMEVDYVGQVYLTQHFLKMVHTTKDAEGHIVFISSVAGKIPVPFRSGYCAAKAALDAYASTIRIELELECRPIAVTVVSPGGVRTAVSKNALNKDGEAFGEADAVTAEGMAVDECVGQMIRGISNKVDDFLVCSSLERFAYRLFSYLPLRTATKAILPKYKKYLDATLAKVAS